VKGVRLSEVDEDIRGIDLEIETLDGNKFPVDVKTGGQRGQETMSLRQGVIELGISKAAIDGFQIEPWYRDALKQATRAQVGYGQIR